MIKPICKDVFLLSQKAVPATEADLPVVMDMLDTLKAHEEDCVGMAANMIGVAKRIIVVNMGVIDVAMLNPVIVKKSKPYEVEESCLSFEGARRTTRYEEIELEFQNIKFQKQRQRFSGLLAQIIQHECDHLEGILI